uniref:Uncharacterized protein n=1 Tax=Solanum lycopersicum TaxID=4081 RepID=A0A494G9V6_SOLLC
MEDKRSFLNAELAAVADREKWRLRHQRRQRTRGNILPPCPANSDDGADQEGDENDRVIKESDGDNE